MAKTYNIKLNTELFYCGPDYQPRVTVIDDYFGVIHAKIRILQDVHNTNQIIGYLPQEVIPKYSQIIYANYQNYSTFDNKSYPILIKQNGEFYFLRAVKYRKLDFIHILCCMYRLN